MSNRERRDEQDLKDGQTLGRLTDRDDTADTGNPAQPGGPETTGVIIHGNDPEDPPTGDEEEGEGGNG